MATDADSGSGGIGDHVDHVDWRESAIYGGGAWLAGLIASYAIATIAGVTDRSGADALDLAVTMYYHAMGGLLAVPENAGGFFSAVRGPSAMTASYGVLESRFYGLAIWLHYLVPAIALLVAGYVLAGKYADGADDYDARLDAWLGGVSAGAVFGGLTLVSVLLFRLDGPDLEAVRLLLAVVAYPALLAGVGAARQVGFGVASLRGFVAGVGALVLSFGLWNVLGDSVIETLLEDPPSGADLYLPMLGEFLATHGTYVKTGFIPETLTMAISQSDPVRLFGSVSPGLFALAGPLLLGAAVVYRSGTTDLRRAAGEGARIGFGYLVGVFLLGAAVFGHWMTKYYDAEYGTGTEAEVREAIFAEANYVFGGLLPDVALVGGLLWPAVFGTLGGIVGAKVVESRLEDASVEPDRTAAADAESTGAGTTE